MATARIPKRGPTNSVTRFLTRISNFDLLSIFDPKRPRPVPRSVLVNVSLPSHATVTAPKIPIWGISKHKEVEGPDGTVEKKKVQLGYGQKEVPGEGWIFESNQVLTSKYNVITFLPRNLLEQFRRVANIFFLILVILQFFPRFYTVSPALAALPLLVVLAITAIKDGYEDLKRHQSDRSINGIQVLALRGSFHNPNISRSKGRSFGLPSFISTFFLKRTLLKEAEEAEEERAERKKGFWGKRKVRRPTLLGKKGAQSLDGAREPQALLDAPGGGVVKEGGKEKEKEKEKGTSKAPFSAPKVPKPEDREDGDHYADEHDSGPLDGPQQPGKLLHTPHLPHFGHHDETQAKWVKESWEDLKVGDFVRLRGDESVPADLVVCATSEEENVCYVETKNLDGETNLKSRHAVPELTHLRTSTRLAQDAKFIIESEPADVNMFQYNAAVVLQDGRLDQDGQPLRCPVNLNTVLLRGTVVRNTDWVIGVVVMTGRDTKIVLNSGGTPSKRSRVERQMNPMVLLNLVLLAAMCIMCAVVDWALQKHYLGRGAYWLFDANRPGDNPSVNGIVTFANALIAFQNIVPISLYISIEFVRLVQAFFIWADDDIMYRSGTTKRRTAARSWNLSDDLGQIEYIFSDKTGTLTQNAMVFQQCSVGGKVYLGDPATSDDTVLTATDVKSASLSDEDATRIPSSTSEAFGGAEKGAGTASGNAPKTKLAAGVLLPFHDAEIERDLAQRESPQATNLYAFFSNLALCHTVLAAEEDGLITYKAQSPDEAALVQAAADVGFVFLGRDKNILRLSTPHDPEVVEFELLNVIEFSSARKRMSVVLRRLGGDSEAGSLVLLTKGADNVIFERLAPGNEELKKTTDSHLEEFANEGLRTLCLAYKPLDEAEYEIWEREYQQATTLIEHRDDEMERVAEKLEINLTLLGATAIEDRLQDGVPEAIADLKRAGLKIWVATGDKLETAIAIAKTCNLLSRDMNVIIIKGGEYGKPNSTYNQLKNALEKFFDASGLVDTLDNQPPEIERSQSRRSGSIRRGAGLHRTVTGASGVSDIVGEDNGTRPGGYGLVIDGASLHHAFAEDFTKDLLLELATRCKAVICCRTSPLQKALIVHLVKDGLGAMCLAIGDGANDVSMIQAADIGVGVAGEEGLQAVNSSDYAIGQFRYLNRLLLVHGHWSYMRNANMIVNFFYKEIIGIGILFWFQFYCGYSATTVYEYTYLLFWNVFWTLVPVIAIGVFDRNINDEVLVKVPELYKYGSGGHLFGLWRFSVYMFDGIYQSAVIYFFLLYTYNTTTARSDGYDIQMYEFSTIMALAAVFAANFYNGLNTHSWNWWVLGGVLIGPVLITLYTAVYSAFTPGFIWTYVLGNNAYLWPSMYFWLGMLFTIILSLLPRYLYRYYTENYRPSDIDILAYVSKRDPNHDWIHDPFMPQVPAGSRFEKEGDSELAHDEAPIFNTATGRPVPSRHDTYQLGRVSTSQSVTHDMLTGAVREGSGRGYGFDQADGMLPAPIRRYTSHTSDPSIRTRPRKGSIRVGKVELNPFLRSPGGRERSSSIRSAIFGNRKSTIPESPETAPVSPTRATAARSRANTLGTEGERMLGE